VRRCLVLALISLLAAPAAASADITGTVRNPQGIPIPQVTVTAREPDGDFADSASTDARGRYTLDSASLSGNTPPFTITASEFDACNRSGDSERTATSEPTSDGQTADFVLQVLTFCSSQSFGSDFTGLVDAFNRRILMAPGGTASVRFLAHSSGVNHFITLPDGTPIGSNPDGNVITITGPANGYSGPIFVHYTSGGEEIVYELGTLLAQPAPAPAPVGGNFDLEAIVDLSGSMSGNDRQFRRKDALRLLLDLMGQGDKIGAVGFDDGFLPIFDLTTISGTAVINNLKTLVNQRVINQGGTNYNIGFQKALEALNGPGVNPQTPKGGIFLTDGGHNSGAYENLHLLFTYNPSGRSWPVCVVQLGTGFQQVDVDRLKRIAAETGGEYAATPTNAQLSSLYFRCFGRATGARTIANAVLNFRQGQQRTFARRIPRRLRVATFFVGWGDGTFDVSLVDPKKKRHSARRPGRNVTFRKGSTYALIRVRKPLAGRWRMLIKARRLPAGRDQASVTITAPGR